jgi:peptidoglycan-associated lipoprotein
MKTTHWIIPVLLGGVFLAIGFGCSPKDAQKTEPPEPEPAEEPAEEPPETEERPAEPQASDEPESDVTVGQVEEQPELLLEQITDPESLLSERVIYFAFDKSRVRDRYTDMIGAHAEFLQAHPEVTLRLEGHADERGSREYNMALGERRAEAVADRLVLFGAGRAQIETVSYGEERPVALGHNEEAWSQNRRVEFRYEGIEGVEG